MRDDELSATRVVVVGEALVDVVHRDGVVAEHPGGSPLNVAYGLGRLGIPVALVTSFGDDPRGEAISAHLASARVEVIRDDVRRRTSVATARIDPDGAADYEFALDWDLAPVRMPPAAVVHTGSAGALRDPGSAVVRRLVEEAASTALITFDPNIRPSLIPEPTLARELVRWYCARADVVKLSDEDAHWLFPGLDVDEVLDRILVDGARLVVVTRGQRGSIMASRSDRVHVEAWPTSVVDTIGAGDAFMAGLIAAIVRVGAVDDVRRGEAGVALLRRLGRTASAAAGLTVGERGAAPPTLERLNAALGSRAPRRI